jgi:hypothetical protein
MKFWNFEIIGFIANLFIAIFLANSVTPITKNYGSFYSKLKNHLKNTKKS